MWEGDYLICHKQDKVCAEVRHDCSSKSGSDKVEECGEQQE